MLLKLFFKFLDNLSYTVSSLHEAYQHKCISVCRFSPPEKKERSDNIVFAG